MWLKTISAQAVVVSFVERRERRSWLSFGGAAEHEWERWFVRLTVREIPDEKGSIAPSAPR